MTGLNHALSVTVVHCNTASVEGLVYYRVISCFEGYSGPLLYCRCVWTGLLQGYIML